MPDFRQQSSDVIVKPASTPAAVTDASMVVALSPNSPTPPGTNTIGTVILGADPDTISIGNITAADAVVGAPAGNGAFLTGASTIGSYLAVLCPGGDTAWTIQLNGAFGGTTVYWEVSMDSTTGADGNWIVVNGRQTGVVNTVLGTGTSSVGLFRGNTSAVKYLRVRAVGGAAINISAILRLSAGSGALFLNASIPAGANLIGNVKLSDGTNTATIKPASTAALATDTALVVAYSPSSPTPAGTNNIGTVNVQGQSITGTNGSIAAAGTGTIGPVLVSAAGNVTFTVKNTIAANAYAGNPVLVFEQSDDNVSWGPLMVTRSDTLATSSTFTLNPNAASASLMFDAALEGVAQVRCRVTTGPVTNALTIVISPGGLPFAPSVSVIQQPITKGTQGITGVTTQDLKDSGRNQVHYYTVIPVLTSATDTLQILTGTKAGATVTATATPAVVTTGKTFRVTRLTATYVATATAGFGLVRLRFQTAGVVTITSPVAATLALGTGTPGTANAAGTANTLDEGWEFSAATGIGISVQGFTGVTATAVGYIMVSVTGYEY
jgi:hypothetical protein